jgi:hypothetical protein
MAGYENLAGEGDSDTSAFVGGGFLNSASNRFALVGGGAHNEASAPYATISGGNSNFVAGDYSAILGGRRDTITSSADYSYLFGIDSKLTEDSTFMVDMPHVRFGDEISGYEFPRSDGTAGQVMSTDGAGKLGWSDASGGTGVVPVGAVTAWLKSFPNTPALPADFVECNGQTLSDPESVYDGQTIPDLNGSGGTKRFLRGASASGAAGGSDTNTHNHGLTSHRSAQGIGIDVQGNYTCNNSDISILPSYYEVVWIMRIK